MFKKCTITFAILATIILSNVAFAQVKTTNLNWKFEKARNEDSIIYYREISSKSNENQLFEVNDFYTFNKSKCARGFSKDKKGLSKIGEWKYFHPNGTTYKNEKFDEDGNQIDSVTGFYPNGSKDYLGFYNKGKMAGNWIYFHPNGKMAAFEIYNNQGEILRMQYFNQLGEEIPTKIGDHFKPAQYGDGEQYLLKFLYSKMVFPEAARYLSESGRTTIKATIEADGRVSKVEVEISSDPILDAEALRVSKYLTYFKPALSHNKPIKSEVLIPIDFKLVISLIETK